MTTRSYEVLEQMVIMAEIDFSVFFDWVIMNSEDLTSDELSFVINIIYKRKPNITRLYLMDNEITYIPECIVLLVYLQKLHLDVNKITSIPKYIGELKHLQELHLAYNEIDNIEDNGLIECYSLNKLTLKYNKNLKNIDMHILEMPMLSYISLAETKITMDELAKYIKTSSLIVTKILILTLNHCVL